MRGLNLEKTEVGTRPDGLSLSNMGSQVRFHPEGDEGGDKVRALISNQYGVPGVVSTSRNGGGDKAGTRPEGLSSTNMGSQVWSQPQEHGLILTSNMGFQVPGEDGGRDEAGGLILNQYGVPGAWSQPEEDGGLFATAAEVVSCIPTPIDLTLGRHRLGRTHDA